MIRTPRVLLASTLALVMAGFFIPAAHADDNVIADDNLKACLNSQMNRPAGTPVTAADLQSDQWPLSLYCQNQGISSLAGVESMATRSDVYVDLQGNAITDLAPLTDLKIGYLDVSGNSITSLAPLSGMTMLHDLRANDNKISDLSPLKDLSALGLLYAGSNQISDMSTVAALTGLVYLGLPGNMITDPSPMSGLPNLMFVSLSNNRISDISGLTDLPRVYSLALDGNQISDISVLASAPTLGNVSLGGNAITDLSPLADMYARSGSSRISAPDQRVRVSVGVNVSVPLPTVSILDPAPSAYDHTLALNGNTLTMTPSSTANTAINGDSITYLAPGRYAWTWRASTTCESGTPNLDPTCWPFIDFSGTAIVTVPGSGTDDNSGADENSETDANKDGSTTDDTSKANNDSLVVSTGGTAVNTVPLAVLLIAAGLVLLVVRRQVSHPTR